MVSVRGVGLRLPVLLISPEVQLDRLRLAVPGPVDVRLPVRRWLLGERGPNSRYPEDGAHEQDGDSTMHGNLLHRPLITL